MPALTVSSAGSLAFAANSESPLVPCRAVTTASAPDLPSPAWCKTSPTHDASGARRQAELLRGRLAGRRWGGFYTSDRERAAETAQILGLKVGAQAEPVRGLREIFLGDWEGLRTEEIAERFPEAWARWVKEPDWDVVPGGEGAADFDGRVGAALDDIFSRRDRGDVLVVTHGAAIQIAFPRVAGRPTHGLFPFKIQNASISLVEKRNGRTVIAGVNDIAHLEAALVTDVGPG